MAESRWQVYKLEIARLYLEEKKTLANVMKVMEETHGFKESERQYRNQLTKWGFGKYNLGAQRLAAVKRKLANLDGEDHEVYIDRILQCPKRIKREANRQVFAPVIETFTSAPSPKTPDGIVICSPGPSAMNLEWPTTLPWFEFSRIAHLPNLRGKSIFSACQPSSKSQDMTNLLPQAQTDMLSFLGSMLSWKTTGRLTSIQSSSRVAAVLSVIMPEEKEGQHFQLAEKLCKPHTFPAQELLEVLLFIISNNLHLQGLDGSSNGWQKDKFIMQIFHLSGLNNVQNLKYLLSQSDATAEAVVENLFGSAMRAYDTTAVRLFLEAGINPNLLVLSDGWGLLSPLAITAYSFKGEPSMEIATLLMAHGADLNSKTGMRSPLACAIEFRQVELVKFFLCQGAIFLQEMLPGTFLNDSLPSDLKLVEVLLAAGTNIVDFYMHGLRSTLTLLGVATREHNLELVKLLLFWGADIEKIQTYAFRITDSDTAFEETTPLGLAAAKGNMKILRALLEAGAKVNVDVNMGLVPPLVLAVEYGHLDATKLLLSEGADVSWADPFRVLGASEECEETNLLTRALKWKNPELCWILIKAGSIADSRHMADVLSFQMIRSIKDNRIEWVSRLLKMGALSNRGSPGHQHDHPLALAIAQGNCEIISLLSRAGVKLTQGSVCSIADIHTANHLRDIGLMPSLLRYGGRQALISAILLNKQDLAMNLLSCNADRRDLSESPSLNCQKWAMFKTPLEAAICRGNKKMAELLINRGASVTDIEVAAFVWRILEKNDVVDFSPFWNSLCSWRPLAPTAIGMALHKGDHVLLNRLLAAGVDLQGQPIAYNQFEIFDWIEENHDAFILTGPKYGMEAGWWNCLIPHAIHPRSVLEIAANSSNGQSMVQDLLMYPWSSEDKGRALTISLKNGKLDLAQILLSSNADVNQCVREGSADPDSYWWIVAPLLTAVERQDLVWTKTLLAAGCDVNLHVEDCDRSATTLGRAVRAGNMNIVKALLTAGALVNDPCSSPNALDIAVQEERLDLVVLLLEAGANINSPAVSDGGRTALQLAVEKGNLQLVDTLLQAGADVNQEPAFEAGATALQLAAIQGFIGIAHKLIDLGANVNAPGAHIEGRTALEGAAEHGHVDTVRLLLEAGASIEGDGRKQYWRAVRLAEENAAHATANVLKSIGGWTDFDSRYATEDILEDDDRKEELVAEMAGYFS